MNNKTILNLRTVTDDVQRGYKFEQIVRELLPWDIKPPVSMMGDSEQLDSIFVWKNQAFVVESKAKKKKITTGSHDWEDFELKIRRRNHTATGLFCSLFPINKNVYNRANELVKEGFLVIVLEGEFWDDLAQSNLSITDVLDYMNLYGRVDFLAVPPKLSNIERWRYDKDGIAKKLSDICLKYSSIMLNRHKSLNHDEIYIKREIERQIDSYIKDIKPSTLTKTKEAPNQICLLRDFSGSGKTTTSIQMTLMHDTYVGVGMTANEQSIDQQCKLFFESLGNDYGIGELRTINKPIIYVIDSLDEASGLAGKYEEVKSIINYIQTLNKKATELGLIIYPVLFIFTIREDYWRDWESIFEGRKKNVICKRISLFNREEFTLALKKYQKSYNYLINNILSNESVEVLSRPINLLIFSETNQYTGEISVDEIWDCSVVGNFFKRKLEKIYSRNIPGSRAEVFLNLLSEMAYSIIKSNLPVIEESEIRRIIETRYNAYSPFCEEIMTVFLSEHIIIQDNENTRGFRFRHSRFLDFLMAYYCLLSVSRTNDIDSLSQLVELIFDSNFVLMFNIHDDMLYICKQKFKKLLPKLDEYYSTNAHFMSRKISRLRAELANNQKIKDGDIALIYKSVSRRNPELIVEAFFVIASKPCMQSDSDVINTFCYAFKSGYNIPEQYKMIQKLTAFGLLCSEKVLGCILQSNYPRNWETYLGGILSNRDRDYSDFIDLWNQVDGNEVLLQTIKKAETEDWSHVKKLLGIIMSGEQYVLGDI